ncbi:MAG: bifunctional diaminohydroxyphosphoribosylaminopyrimidine deaminase/5-amino-6-(5-phosphoribosylamino)uracil reductase RibD, partial [Desulfobaccales bacterium]
ASRCIIFTMHAIDATYMKLALKLAARGAGWVSPNPMVGAVVVKDGQVVGRGYHRRVGLPHAEVEALRAAGAAARGAELYVTLEPCNHEGRTPPCTRAILSAGISRVIIATRDPNPRVAGGGDEFLRSRGVPVEVGLLEVEARRLNEAWFHWVATGRPWVTVKAACSLDGKIATAGGESQWLTGEAARALGHRLRHRVDAIVVGIGTVLADDPQLTTRLAGGRKMGGGEGQGPTAAYNPSPNPPPPTPYGDSTGFQPEPGMAGPARIMAQSPSSVFSEKTKNEKRKTKNAGKDPIRLVLDSKLRIPLTARLLHLDSPAPTWVATTGQAPPAKRRALEDLGARVLVLPEAAGRVSLPGLLEFLGAQQVQSLLVEGGAEVLGAFFDQKLVHLFRFFYAPTILGGRAALGVVGGLGVDRLKEASRAQNLEIRRVGEDFLVSGYL